DMVPVNKNINLDNIDDRALIELRIYKKEIEQLNFVIDKIQEYIKNGYTYDDIAILGRNTYHLKKIEVIFEQSKIPYSSLINDKNTKKSEEDIFDYYDFNDNKEDYVSSDIIDMLNGSKLNDMRNLRILPKIKPSTTTLFEHKYAYEEIIKNNAYESDFTIY